MDGRKVIMKRIACVLMLTVFAAVLGSCGQKTKSGDPAPYAAGWKKFETVHFVLMDPLDSPRASQVSELADVCENVFNQLVTVLKLDVPQRIWIYRFVTNQDCENKTGHSAGYVEGYRILTRIGSPLGGAIALAACSSIDPGHQANAFLRNGLREAFDKQDLNVHREAATLHATDHWVPLSEFLSSEAITDHSAYDIESGSFVAYLIQRHGVDKFKELWRSQLDLKTALQKICGGTIDQIADDWIAHMTREANKT